MAVTATFSSVFLSLPLPSSALRCDIVVQWGINPILAELRCVLNLYTTINIYGLQKAKLFCLLWFLYLVLRLGCHVFAVATVVARMDIAP